MRLTDKEGDRVKKMLFDVMDKAMAVHDEAMRASRQAGNRGITDGKHRELTHRAVALNTTQHSAGKLLVGQALSERFLEVEARALKAAEKTK